MPNAAVPLERTEYEEILSTSPLAAAGAMISGSSIGNSTLSLDGSANGLLAAIEGEGAVVSFVRLPATSDSRRPNTATAMDNTVKTRQAYPAARNPSRSASDRNVTGLMVSLRSEIVPLNRVWVRRIRCSDLRVVAVEIAEQMASPNDVASCNDVI